MDTATDIGFRMIGSEGARERIPPQNFRKPAAKVCRSQKTEYIPRGERDPYKISESAQFIVKNRSFPMHHGVRAVFLCLRSNCCLITRLFKKAFEKRLTVLHSSDILDQGTVIWCRNQRRTERSRTFLFRQSGCSVSRRKILPPKPRISCG